MEQIQIEQGIRLQQLIKALNLKQASFAQSLGMTQPNISRMVSGESRISVEVLNQRTVGRTGRTGKTAGRGCPTVESRKQKTVSTVPPHHWSS